VLRYYLPFATKFNYLRFSMLSKIYFIEKQFIKRNRPLFGAGMGSIPIRSNFFDIPQADKSLYDVLSSGFKL